MAEIETVGGILLAGGAGTRFGGRKLLHPLTDGTAVGVAAWRNLRAAVKRSIVVIRNTDLELAARFSAEGATVVECTQAHLGMGHSLVCGVSALRRVRMDRSLGDMPRVQPSTIVALAQRLAAGARIVVPVWEGGAPSGGSPPRCARNCSHSAATAAPRATAASPPTWSGFQ
jgi:molybdenum cofactor cytidylyltransferase